MSAFDIELLTMSIKYCCKELFHICGTISGSATGKKSIKHSFIFPCQPIKSHQMREKQLLIQCSFMTSTVMLEHFSCFLTLF